MQSVKEQPYETSSDTAKALRVVYTGSAPFQFSRNGNFFRMIPRNIIFRDMSGIDSCVPAPYTILNFCDNRGVYVPGYSTIDNFETMIRPLLPENPNVLIMRDEGAGDIIMSIPTMRELRKRLPDAHITYATKPVFFCLLNGIDFIDDVVSVHDLDLTTNAPWDFAVNYCRALEDYKVRRNRGLRIDSFAKQIGLTLTDKSLSLCPAKEDYLKAIELLDKRNGGPLVGYVVQAAAWNRTYPPEKVHALLEEFERQMPGAQIVLIDKQEITGELFEDHENIIDLCGKTDTFMEAAAVCSQLDAVITQDTGLAHACVALGKKTLVLIGSIPPESRFVKNDNVRFIHPAGRVDCCPCWDWQEEWPVVEWRARNQRHMSCEFDKMPHCLNTITAEEIVDKTADLLAGAE